MKKTKKPEANKIRSGMQVEFVCPKCGKHLAWALPETQMICPKCGTWITNKNRKKAEMDLLLPTDDDQLALF